jgi:Uncharacterized conserved protein
MARIKLGIGMSHSPMMAMDGKYWIEFAKTDESNPFLYDEKGNHLTYEQLEKKRNGLYRVEATPERFEYLFQEMKKSYAHLKEQLNKAQIDVLVVIGNDHPGEFLDLYNVPAFAVFYGEKIISMKEEDRTRKLGRKQRMGEIPEALQQMKEGMGMDQNHVWPGHPPLALHLISSLLEQGVDAGALKEVDDPSRNGHGHGYGMVVTELMDKDRLIPMVPIYLNTWPPNEIPTSRCYDIGLKIRKAVEEWPEEANVGIVISGGLSHFVTDEDLDRTIIDALLNKKEDVLRGLPRHLIHAGPGNSEIRNWVMGAAVLEQLPMAWHRYLPVFRTGAGTGIGMTFALWQ